MTEETTQTDAEKRLTAARERIAKARAESEALDAAAAAEDEAARAELEAERAELAVAYTKQYGKRGVGWDFVPCLGAIVAVRCPTYTAWQNYREADHPTDTRGLRELIFQDKSGGSPCLLKPDRRGFDALEKTPGHVALLDSTGLAVVKLANAAHNERQGK